MGGNPPPPRGGMGGGRCAGTFITPGIMSPIGEGRNPCKCPMAIPGREGLEKVWVSPGSEHGRLADGATAGRHPWGPGVPEPPDTVGL